MTRYVTESAHRTLKLLIILPRNLQKLTLFRTRNQVPSPLEQQSSHLRLRSRTFLLSDLSPCTSSPVGGRGRQRRCPPTMPVQSQACSSRPAPARSLPGPTASPQERAAASSTRRLRAAGGELTPTAEGAQSHRGGSEDALTAPGASAHSPAARCSRPHPPPFRLRGNASPPLT